MSKNMTPALWEQLEGARLSTQVNPSLVSTPVEGLTLDSPIATSEAAMQALILRAMGWAASEMAFVVIELVEGDELIEVHQVLKLALNIDGEEQDWLITSDRVVSVATLTGEYEAGDETFTRPEWRLVQASA